MAFKFQKPDAAGWPVLPEGDYKFTVTSCSMPAQTEKGYEMIRLELLVEGQKVWDNRSAGTSDKGEFDMISPFLVAVNRIPNPKQELSPVFWAGLAGAKGIAHLAPETYQGVERNKVKYYHAPKQAAPQNKDQYGRPKLDPNDDLVLEKAAGPEIPY